MKATKAISGVYYVDLTYILHLRSIFDVANSAAGVQYNCDVTFPWKSGLRTKSTEIDNFTQLHHPMQRTAGSGMTFCTVNINN